MNGGSTGAIGGIPKTPRANPLATLRALWGVIVVNNEPLAAHSAADFVRRTVSCPRAQADLLDALGLEG